MPDKNLDVYINFKSDMSAFFAAGRQTAGVLRGIGQAAQQVNMQLTATRQLLTYGLGTGVAGMGLLLKQGLGVAAQFESINLELNTMIKNQEQVKRLTKDLVTMAATTPFQLEEIFGSAKQIIDWTNGMGDMNFRLSETIRLLRIFGEVAAVKKPAGGIDQVVRAAFQTRGGLWESQQLVPLGITKNNPELLAAGLKFDSSGQLATAGDEAFKIITEYWEKAYGGLFEKVNETLAGKGSNFKDTVTLLFKSAGEGIIDEAKRLLQQVIDAINGLLNDSGAMAGLQQAARELFSAFTPLVAQGTGLLTRLITLLKEDPQALVNGVRQFIGVLKVLAAALAAVISAQALLGLITMFTNFAALLAGGPVGLIVGAAAAIGIIALTAKFKKTLDDLIPTAGGAGSALGALQGQVAGVGTAAQTSASQVAGLSAELRKLHATEGDPRKSLQLTPGGTAGLKLPGDTQYVMDSSGKTAFEKSRAEYDRLWGKTVEYVDPLTGQTVRLTAAQASAEARRRNLAGQPALQYKGMDVLFNSFEEYRAPAAGQPGGLTPGLAYNDAVVTQYRLWQLRNMPSGPDRGSNIGALRQMDADALAASAGIPPGTDPNALSEEQKKAMAKAMQQQRDVTADLLQEIISGFSGNVEKGCVRAAVYGMQALGIPVPSYEFTGDLLGWLRGPGKNWYVEVSPGKINSPGIAFTTGKGPLGGPPHATTVVGKEGKLLLTIDQDKMIEKRGTGNYQTAFELRSSTLPNLLTGFGGVPPGLSPERQQLMSDLAQRFKKSAELRQGELQEGQDFIKARTAQQRLIARYEELGGEYGKQQAAAARLTNNQDDWNRWIETMALPEFQRMKFIKAIGDPVWDQIVAGAQEYQQLQEQKLAAERRLAEINKTYDEQERALRLKAALGGDAGVGGARERVRSLEQQLENASDERTRRDLQYQMEQAQRGLYNAQRGMGEEGIAQDLLSLQGNRLLDQRAALMSQYSGATTDDQRRELQEQIGRINDSLLDMALRYQETAPEISRVAAAAVAASQQLMQLAGIIQQAVQRIGASIGGAAGRFDKTGGAPNGGGPGAGYDPTSWVDGSTVGGGGADAWEKFF